MNDVRLVEGGVAFVVSGSESVVAEAVAVGDVFVVQFGKNVNPQVAFYEVVSLAAKGQVNLVEVQHEVLQVLTLRLMVGPKKGVPMRQRPYRKALKCTPEGVSVRMPEGVAVLWDGKPVLCGL